MSQFKLFSKLPPELRVQIWDFAIRDNGPAAHFFTIYNNDSICLDPNFTVNPESRVPDTPRGHRRPFRFGLAAPHNSPNNEYSWVDGNPSAYMTDSGLWTACWESRERMMRHFQPNKASSQYTESEDSQDGGPVNPPATILSDAPVTLPFRRDNGERQQLTIRPSEDLICLQFDKGAVFPRQGKYRWSLLRNLPPFIRRRPGGWGWEETSFRHAAIEFDPVWFETWMEDFLFPGSPLELFSVTGFWFINRSLERKYRTGEDRSSRRTFRDASGMELVEVVRGDDEWRDRSWGRGAYDRYWQYRSEVNDLAEWLNRTVVMDTMFDFHMLMSVREDESNDDSADDEMQAPHFGVLACVRPGSETHLPTKSEWMKGCQ